MCNRCNYDIKMFYIVENPDVYVQLSRSLILSKLFYSCAIWRPHEKKHIDLLRSMQSKFMSCLRWRCTFRANDFVFPSILSILDVNERANVNALGQLERAELVSHFFVTRHNNLRSRGKMLPKDIAHTEQINNVYAWRISRWLCANSTAARKLLVSHVLIFTAFTLLHMLLALFILKKGVLNTI